MAMIRYPVIAYILYYRLLKSGTVLERGRFNEWRWSDNNAPTISPIQSFMDKYTTEGTHK
jgi:hypothetical protein